MSVVARTGRTSSSVKKARLEAERSKLVGRMDECDQKEETKQREKKTKYDCVYKLVIMGDTVRDILLVCMRSNYYRAWGKLGCLTGFLDRRFLARIIIQLL